MTASTYLCLLSCLSRFALVNISHAQGMQSELRLEERNQEISGSRLTSGSGAGSALRTSSMGQTQV